MKLSKEENEYFPVCEYIQIKCAHYLKLLGYNENTFTNLRKDEIIQTLKRIWQKDAFRPMALEVIILISIEHKVDHGSLWNSVLKQMVNLKMVCWCRWSETIFNF